MSIRDKVEYGVSTFRGLGMSQTQALGAIGSLMGESGRGLNTGALNPNDPGDGSFGIGQWHSDRRRALERFAKKQGTAVTDYKTQVDFIAKELQTTEKRTLSSMLKAKDLKTATRTWTNKYERPNQKYAHHNKRTQNASYAQGLLNGEEVDARVIDESFTGATNVTGYVDEEQDPEAFRDPYAVKVDPTTGLRVKSKKQGIEEEGILDQVGAKIGSELSNLASPQGVIKAVGKIGGLPNEITDVVGGLFGKPATREPVYVDETGFPTAPDQNRPKNALGILESPVTNVVRSMFGEANTGAKIGAVAGGMIGGGPIGALIGGVIGQGINAMFSRMQQEDALMRADDGTKLQRWTSSGDSRFDGLGGTDIGTGGNGMEGGLW
ncbi:hypothetical protein Bpfe_031141 [Biomphalaria pfeifferi]|uniref:Phage tail lysozyme domain-containing protein n=1 Tax=Biomphalaria pfeifferi TaxID=112525 RepID=A0AAD8ANG6_BIOPF|nr:hypothetical protein Bpfe_031141 [Biomphalaria pfeifferi]